MRQTQRTGKGGVQHLKCGMEQVSTDSAIHDANLFPVIIILCLQEPWTDTGGQPPSSHDFDLFTTTKKKPRSSTYVRKQLILNPREPLSFADSIKVTITIKNRDIDLLNIYSPGRSLHIANQCQRFKPILNTDITGHFNAHHTWW